MEAQTFTVPADTTLSSFQFQMFAAPFQAVKLEIFAWGASGPTGGALFTSPSMPRVNMTQDFLVSNINLLLTLGGLYGAVIDTGMSAAENAAYNTNQNSYKFGNMWLLQQNLSWINFPADNLLFQATFVQSAAGGATPEPVTILLIGGGLTAIALLRRRLG